MSPNTATMPLRPAIRPTGPLLGNLFGTIAGFFSSRRAPDHGADRDSTAGLSRMEPTRPYVSRRDQHRVDKAMPASAGNPTRRGERLAQRDLVFQLVRESMVRAGVLSSGYKFKALSLDQRGTQFLVMMDLAAEFGGQTDRLAEIEALIAQSAKHRHNVLIQAVYWRFNEHVVLGRPSGSAQAIPAATGTAQAPMARAGAAQIRLPAQPRFEPLLVEELEAFKRAVEIGSAPMPAKAAGPKATGLLLTGYEDTEVADENEGMPALSATQYGDLPMH